MKGSNKCKNINDDSDVGDGAEGSDGEKTGSTADPPESASERGAKAKTRKKKTKRSKSTIPLESEVTQESDIEMANHTDGSDVFMYDASDAAEVGEASSNEESSVPDLTGHNSDNCGDATEASLANGNVIAEKSVKRSHTTTQSPNNGSHGDGNWTASEDATLLSMKEGNETWATIAKAIGRGKRRCRSATRSLRLTANLQSSKRELSRWWLPRLLMRATTEITR